MSIRSGASVVLLLLAGVVGCGSDELEQRVQQLDEQVQTDARAIVELTVQLRGTEIAVAEAEAWGAAANRVAKDAQERAADLERTVTVLEEQLGELEAKLDKPAAPSVVAAGRPDPAVRYRVPVGGSATRGPEDAEVTIVMFTDFQCPFCKRVQTTLRRIEDEYGDDVRLVTKHNPLSFHRQALPAARAAEAAHRQGKFWEMHDLLYEHGRELDKSNFVAWAKKIGCDRRTFERDFDDSKLAERIAADKRLAERVGARGTPAFFVNGRFLSGAQPFVAFEKVIEEELAEAKRRIAAGTPARGVYEALMREAKSGV